MSPMPDLFATQAASARTSLGPQACVLHGFALAQADALLAGIEAIAAAAPFRLLVTPGGHVMQVAMTNCGRFGWTSDRRGYRYVDRHPDGTPWPPIPEGVLAIWRALVGAERMPDCCLVNLYDAGARMGLHRDADEADFSWPALSISLGDSAVFRMGGQARSDPTTSVVLDSGDVVVFGGEARLAYHGIDRIRAGSSTLLPQGGRINLTCRVVD